jgi:lysylphosphatidylglycerol synthetase-like protein (DUF2156 family)
MEKQVSPIQRFFCYILDKVFHGIMILLYGAHPSETRAQKLSRWIFVLVIIIGIMLLYSVIKAIFGPPGPVRMAPLR